MAAIEWRRQLGRRRPHRTARTTVLCALALFVLVVARHDAEAQTAPPSVDESATADTGFGEVEEIIVRSRRLSELRFEVSRFEDGVFARFNEINSTLRMYEF